MSRQVGGLAILTELRKKSENNFSVVVGFGSETGTGEEIAKIIHSHCGEMGLSSRIMCLDTIDLKKVHPSIFIIVTSSTGDGDPPLNAQKFCKNLLKEKDSESLDGLRFTLVGLGDSNYTRFQNVPRLIKKKMLADGVCFFYQPIEVDEVEGIDDALDNWMEGLWDALREEKRREKKEKR